MLNKLKDYEDIMGNCPSCSQYIDQDFMVLMNRYYAPGQELPQRGQIIEDAHFSTVKVHQVHATGWADTKKGQTDGPEWRLSLLIKGSCRR